ncbi:hypothetical protein FLX56_02085 [Synechococcus moorigangaii CMS01]|nr:hypothetical protein [Synechococcus moorigangaii CMS01]
MADFDERLYEVLISSNVRTADKLICVLAETDAPVPVAGIKQVMSNLGFNGFKSWNISQSLTNVPQFARRLSEGWALTPQGIAHANGIKGVDVTVSKYIKQLEEHQQKIEDENEKLIISEAIGCLKHSFYRAAVILSWQVALNHIEQWVYKSHLQEFNEALKRAGKKEVVKMSDFQSLKESDLLDALGSSKLVSKSRKAILFECLNRRNRAGHPNDTPLKETDAVNHIDSLIDHAFQV